MGKGSPIPYDGAAALKIWAQVMNARERCALNTPIKADPMKGWQQADFDAAVPKEETYSWFLAYLYLQLVLTEEWKEAHKQWVHFSLEDCRKALAS